MTKWAKLIGCLLLILIGICFCGCSKPTQKTKSISVKLPPIGVGEIPFYVFKGQFSSLDEAKHIVFKDHLASFHLYEADYTNADVDDFLVNNGFKNYKSQWIHGWESFICYSGGEIENRITYRGSAKVIVEVIPHVGWYRIH